MAGAHGFESLSSHLLLRIFDKLDEGSDRKAWRLTCRHFYILAVDNQRSLRLFNADLLQQLLRKHPSIQYLDLSPCTRVTDENLACVAQLVGNRLLSLNLLRLGSTFTVAGITTLVRGCYALVDVDLSSCSIIGDLELAAISQLERLRTLKLIGCYMISDAGLGCLAAGCKRLEVLILKGCVGISDAGLCFLASNCKMLNTIDVSHTEITDAGLRCLSSLLYLKVLNVSGCSNVGDAGLERTSPSVLDLDVSRCENVTDAGIASLAGGNIQSLRVGHCPPITCEHLESIGRLNGLQTLKLVGCDVIGDALHFVGSGCLQLRELSLSKCKGVTDAGITSILSRCRNLQKLDLTCCRELTEATVYSIARFNRGPLVTLKVEACNMLGENSIALLTEHCRRLEELDLTDCNVSDTGLKYLSQLRFLTSLKLGYSDVGDSGIRHIGRNCCNLIELDLYRSGSVGDLGIASIASGCPKLKFLILSYCPNISDASVVSISQLKRLQQLEMRGCKRITLAGLKHSIADFTNLVELDLKHCNVGDSGMTTIAHRFPNLQELNVSYCPISNRGLVKIEKLSCLQNVKLVHLGSVTMDCVTTTLSNCICLKKVKLLLQQKSDIPEHVYQRLEQRGCRLRWLKKG